MINILGFSPILARRARRYVTAWLVRDTYTTDRAAGAVNGTAAEPGPGNRTVTDASSLLYIGTTTIPYLLYDHFLNNLAAGSVNGTVADERGGARTVTDVESKLSVTGA